MSNEDRCFRDARPELDLCNEAFDAEKCLQVADMASVHVPVPDVQEYKHLINCLPLVPPDVRQHVKDQHDVKEPMSAEAKARRDAKRAFILQRTSEYHNAVTRAGESDPLLRIALRVRKGPLMLLRRSLEAAAQVDVTLRHATGIRGVLRGRLCGFDKYFNMLLADAQEIFVTRERVVRMTSRRGDADSAALASGRMPAGQAGGAVPVQTRVGWRQVLRQRGLSRLLLRGDHVVSVQPVAGPLRLPAPLARFQPECDAFLAQGPYATTQ